MSDAAIRRAELAFRKDPTPGNALEWARLRILSEEAPPEPPEDVLGRQLDAAQRFGRDVTRALQTLNRDVEHLLGNMSALLPPRSSDGSGPGTHDHDLEAAVRDRRHLNPFTLESTPSIPRLEHDTRVKLYRLECDADRLYRARRILHFRVRWGHQQEWRRSAHPGDYYGTDAQELATLPSAQERLANDMAQLFLNDMRGGQR